MCFAQEVKPAMLAGRLFLDAANLYGIVHFNFLERSELTSIFTSDFTSESSVINTLRYEKD